MRSPDILQDLRYAARQISRRPGFSSIVIVTLALGVGATTTAFSILNAFALTPPPYDKVERLVSVYTAAAEGGANDGRVPLRALPDIVQSDVLEAAAAYTSGERNVAAASAAERVTGTEISGELFDVLGIDMTLGRGILPAEQHSGAAVAVIGHSVWTRLYEAGPDVLGRTLLVDGQAFSIVGVAPQGFDFPGGARVWLPMDRAPGADPARTVSIVARVRDGVTVAQADAALRNASQGAAIDGDASAPRVLRAVSLHESMISSKHQNAATALLVAAACVLIVACANLAGLLLASMSGRRLELALRGAIGAGRWRIVRQLMTESLLFAAIGGGLGVIVAYWGLDLFLTILPTPTWAGWMQFTIDTRVLLFALAVSAGAAVVFGLAPAMTASRVDIRGVLSESAGQAGSAGRAPLHRRMLVAGQLAVSLALVAASSSVIASSIGLEEIPTGFDPERLMRARVSLAGPSYDTAAARLAFVDRTLATIRLSPGVEAATATSHAPLMDRNIGAARVVVDPALPEYQQPVASLRFVAADYPSVMGLPVRGRSFVDAEARDERSLVVIVNDTMARRYWKDGDPAGRTISLVNPQGGRVPLTIVGVAADVAQRQLPAAPENQIYLPLARAREVSLVMRTSGDPSAQAPAIRKAIAAIDPTLPVSFQTMTDAYAWYIWDRRGQGIVIAALGAIALLLAALGVYGVMSLLVTSRQREIGVRMALGGTPSAILRMVLGAGFRLSAGGLAVGLLLAIAATNGLASIFYAVRAFDYRVLALSAGLLAGSALMASWWPARRAMRTDPMSVLKAER